MLVIAAIAQWIRMRLPSFCPGFESQAHHLLFNLFIFDCVMWNKLKKGRDRPIFLKKIVNLHVQ